MLRVTSVARETFEQTTNKAGPQSSLLDSIGDHHDQSSSTKRFHGQLLRHMGIAAAVVQFKQSHLNKDKTV